VVVFRTSPVPSFVAVTSASATTPPLLSVTTPLRLPLPSWDCARAEPAASVITATVSAADQSLSTAAQIIKRATSTPYGVVILKREQSSCAGWLRRG
jgi:hypothetical protein